MKKKKLYVEGFIRLISDSKVFILTFFVLAVFAAIQSLLLSNKSFDGSSNMYSNYNNYIIFKQSFYHLIQNKDLYMFYPSEHWDLFKYSPTFAFFFGIFAI